MLNLHFVAFANEFFCRIYAEGNILISSGISFAQLNLSFDIQALQTDVNSLLELQWIEHVNVNDYQGDWNILALRCPAQYYDQHAILQSFAVEQLAQWTNLPALQRSDNISELIGQLQCEVGAVRLMRLKSNAYIKPHRDKGLAMEYGEARLHLPIYSDKGVEFVVNDKKVPMQMGELWYINADQTHWVRNNGEQDRINLVIDCKVNAWLRRLILNV